MDRVNAYASTRTMERIPPSQPLDLCATFFLHPALRATSSATEKANAADFQAEGRRGSRRLNGQEIGSLSA